MTLKGLKPSDKAVIINNFTTNEQQRLKEHYETFNKNLELGEEFFGISERLNKYEPIKAEMQNYEIDFHINEIGTDGKECLYREGVLASRVPKEFYALAQLPIVKKNILAKHRLQACISAVRAFRSSADSFDIYVDDDEKETRLRDLHKELEFLRDERPDLIVYPAKGANKKSCMRVKPYNPKTDAQYEKEWGYKKDYLFFVLKKVDMPLRKPINFLAEKLRLSPQSFEIAQMKEALPTSHQWISVERPHYIKDLYEAFRPKSELDFRIGNFEYRSKPLQLGDLKGNRYRIALRGLEIESTSTVVECLDHLKDIGFINYFGEKRFMSRKLLPTAEVGKLLLTRCWKEAIDLLLKPTNEDPSDIKALKERYFIYHSDWDKVIPKDFQSTEYEYKIMQQLRSSPNNYLGALEEIPIGIRMGFVFAYQSYIWNVIVSQKIKRRGLKLEEGDIVWIGKETDFKEEFYEEYALAFESRSVPKVGFARNVNNKPNYRPFIHFVTKEDIVQNKYTIKDLVMPLPGSEVIFPKNEVGIWYSDFLQMDGLTKTRLNDKFALDKDIIQNSYYLRGSYRRVVVELKDFKWDFKTYGDVTEPIIYTNPKQRVALKQPDKGNEKLALKIDFTLPGDSYVFMAMRELVNLETSGLQNMYEMMRRHVPKVKQQKPVDRPKSISKSKLRDNKTKPIENLPKKRPVDGSKERQVSSSRERLDGRPRTILDGGRKPDTRYLGVDGKPKSRPPPPGLGIDRPNNNKARNQPYRPGNDRPGGRGASNFIDLTEESDRMNRGERGSNFSHRSPVRQLSPDFRGRRGGSREVMARDSLIEVRLTNEHAQPFHHQQPHIDIFDTRPASRFDEPSGYNDPFNRDNSTLRTVDGVAICEFRTPAGMPPKDEADWDREERLRRQVSIDNRREIPRGVSRDGPREVSRSGPREVSRSSPRDSPRDFPRDFHSRDRQRSRSREIHSRERARSRSIDRSPLRDSYNRQRQVFERPAAFERPSVFDRQQNSSGPTPIAGGGNIAPLMEENFDRSRFSSRAEQDRFEAGRLLQPPAYLNRANIRSDDLRNQLRQNRPVEPTNVYDPEREFEENERRQEQWRPESLKRFAIEQDPSPITAKSRRLDDTRKDIWDSHAPVQASTPYNDRGRDIPSDQGYREERAAIVERLDQINRQRQMTQQLRTSPTPIQRSYQQTQRDLSPPIQRRREPSPYRAPSSPPRAPSPPIISGYRPSPASPPKRDANRGSGFEKRRSRSPSPKPVRRPTYREDNDRSFNLQDNQQRNLSGNFNVKPVAAPLLGNNNSSFGGSNNNNLGAQWQNAGNLNQSSLMAARGGGGPMQQQGNFGGGPMGGSFGPSNSGIGAGMMNNAPGGPNNFGMRGGNFNDFNARGSFGPGNCGIGMMNNGGPNNFGMGGPNIPVGGGGMMNSGMSMGNFGGNFGGPQGGNFGGPGGGGPLWNNQGPMGAGPPQQQAFQGYNNNNNNNSFGNSGPMNRSFGNQPLMGNMRRF